METENKAFRKMLEEAIGADHASIAFSAFERPASVSVRLNPYKKSPNFPGSAAVPWSEHGRVLNERPVFTLDPLFHAGTYYVQDSSSMYVGHVLRQVLQKQFSDKEGVIKVLDLCAAPGGKTTDAAASLRQFCGDRFLLTANEVMKNRAQILSENIAVWGDPNTVLTSVDPSAFRALKDSFDIILTDVPCSGEGMFRKDDDAIAMWSEDNVKLCASRQRRIVADVWPALAPGGFLIYSTCTFNKYENDENVEWAASELGAEIRSEDFCEVTGGVLKTKNGCSLIPGLVPGEGQYCAVLQKKGERPEERRQERPAKQVKSPMEGKLATLFAEDVILYNKGEMIKAVPKAVWAQVQAVEMTLRPWATGCAVGTVKGKDFIPDADLALSYLLADNAFREVEAEEELALAFLRKENIPSLDAEKGYIIIKYKGARLGFVKNLGNRTNNLHPQARRIRMI